MTNSDFIPAANDAVPTRKRLHSFPILDEVLDQSAEEEASSVQAGKPAKARGYKHPVIIDFVLAGGLIFAVGGFTAGLLLMYVTHLAEQSLKRHDYPAAVSLLDGIPLPQYFLPAGSESRELFDRSLYLDAMQKLNNNPEDQVALRELDKIMPGSQFFDSSQDLLTEHFKPAPITLTGGASKVDQVSEADMAKMQAEQRTAESINQY